MYDPRFRMAILITMIVFALTGVHLVYDYGVAGMAFNLHAYVQGVGMVGGSILGGLIFVLICSRFITFERYKTTGFEPTFLDESGTGFNFPVSLSRFVPDMIAAPADESLHPVECEIMGFLNAYRNWPYDLTGHDRDSLYEHTLKNWRAMRQLEHTSYPHRIAALAQDLGKVYTYVEKRKHQPLWLFWEQDKVKHGRRCIEHNGHAALVMSTMPSFKNMPEKERRAILIAVRYRDNPGSIPANCDPLAMEIYEALHQAAQKVQADQEGEAGATNISADTLEQFNAQLESYFQAVFRTLELNPMGQTSRNDGIYIGDGMVVVRLARLIKAFATSLSPDVRNALNMWGLDGKPHPCWKVFINSLSQMGLVVDRFHDTPARGGLFNLKIGEQDYRNSLVMKIDLVRHTDLRHALDALHPYNGMIDVEQNNEALLDEINQKAAQVDDMLRQIRQAV